MCVGVSGTIAYFLRQHCYVLLFSIVFYVALAGESLANQVMFVAVIIASDLGVEGVMLDEC